MLRAAPRIRPAEDTEVPLAVEALRRAGFSGDGIVRLLEYPRRSAHGIVMLADGRTSPQGVVCCAVFARTGWIGALGVLPGARRRGLGQALTETATAWLREHGAETVLLYATEMGRPVYERLGFVAEGSATAWRGVAGDGLPSGVPAARPLVEGDRAGIRAVDEAATGERRDVMLDAVRPLYGMGVDAADGSGLAGWALRSPWGTGAAIAARDPDAGLHLLAGATDGPLPGTLVVPDANEPARRALRSWGFARLNSAERMRLGPAVAWRPERQFGLFNLFWG
ncbi:GNAT family N-acetyltransferase [Conexibacter sp. SYSU D00693]|uniref:GNAT family N-acetyltransferase n=1 Tax=Conexibacter sp. SYSU D00693 TaxID=2812560 RepID=UPI00196B53BE|nr:GNAT family N-acetyltransferase [Conexibacter sp. SYSU D00693]